MPEKPKQQEFETLAAWPSREEYVRRREQFLQENRESFQKQLVEYGFPEEISFFMATIIARAQFCYEFVSKQTSLESKIRVNLSWPSWMHKALRGGVNLQFLVNGIDATPKEAYVALKDGSNEVTLQTPLEITMNVQEVRNKAQHILRHENWMKENYPDEVGKLITERLDEESIKFELTIVEEVAHVLYIAGANGHRKKMERLLEDLSDYRSLVPADDDLIPIYSEEEKADKKKNYAEKRVELKAAVLENAFKRKYFPNFEE